MDLQELICRRKQSFYNREEFYDVSFQFLDSTKTVQANKMILTLISPVFEAMFYGRLAETAPSVTITDVEANVFQEFIR